MTSVARVVPESNLLQLDREFDFLVPDGLEVEFGSRVTFKLGRSQKLHTGYVSEILETSPWATSKLVAVVGQPVLKREVLALAKQVAARQCVALGEVLALAIPDHMPRIELPERRGSAEQSKLVQAQSRLTAALEPLAISHPLPNRIALLSSLVPIAFEGQLIPDWALLFARSAIQRLSSGQSSILVVPEADEARLLLDCFALLGLSDSVVYFAGKKADRFKAFHAVLSADACIVVGHRSAVLAPANNLGLVCLFDDLDESLRDQGSPHLHARELALMRSTDMIFAANYRSPDLQRLVEIGFLTELSYHPKTPQIAFSAGPTRLDSGSFRLLREALETGPMLVLTPNRGQASGVFCADCSRRLGCRHCGGAIWAPAAGVQICRTCKATATSCACGSTRVRLGRAGSERTVSELGRAFPQISVVEASAGRKPRLTKRQIIVATPGSAPRPATGYAAVVILDADVWLGRETLRAEQLALRDWQEAIALLAPGGRAHIAGVSQELGRIISLQLLREHGESQLAEARALRLPPALRVASISGTRDTVTKAVSGAVEQGAELLRVVGEDEATAIIRFSYSNGPTVAGALKTSALQATPRNVSGKTKRGLKIVMDDQEAI